MCEQCVAGTAYHGRPILGPRLQIHPEPRACAMIKTAIKNVCPKPGTLVRFTNTADKSKLLRSGWCTATLKSVSGKKKWIVRYDLDEVVDCSQGDVGMILGFVEDRYVVLVGDKIAAIPHVYLTEESE